MLFAILQKYDFSSKSQRKQKWIDGAAGCLRYCKSTIFQANHNRIYNLPAPILVVCDTAKVRFFKQITTYNMIFWIIPSCLRYCKSTIFQANHNNISLVVLKDWVVCDTAKVRFFKQITTIVGWGFGGGLLFAILQKYDFSSKSQQTSPLFRSCWRCLRYCKSTIFQANHNKSSENVLLLAVVCDTAKVRFFKQITTFSI